MLNVMFGNLGYVFLSVVLISTGLLAFLLVLLKKYKHVRKQLDKLMPVPSDEFGNILDIHFEKKRLTRLANHYGGWAFRIGVLWAITFFTLVSYMIFEIL